MHQHNEVKLFIILVNKKSYSEISLKQKANDAKNMTAHSGNLYPVAVLIVPILWRWSRHMQ